MTNDELRVKVAEALGWTPFAPEAERLAHPTIAGMWVPPECAIPFPGKDMDEYLARFTAARTVATMPAWETDLNACHAFEEELTGDEKFRFRNELVSTPHEIADWLGIHATARQRCLALLAVKGLLGIANE
jgi:hypothetical protein